MEVELSETAVASIAKLTKGKTADPVRARKVAKALRLLADDPHHPGLVTHRFKEMDDEVDEKVWQSYVENNVSGAWRMWWFFGPDSGQIFVIDVGPHPD